MSKWWPMCKLIKDFNVHVFLGIMVLSVNIENHVMLILVKTVALVFDQIDGFKCICSNSYTGFIM